MPMTQPASRFHGRWTYAPAWVDWTCQLLQWMAHSLFNRVARGCTDLTDTLLSRYCERPQYQSRRSGRAK